MQGQGGGVETATVGKDFSQASLSFKGKEFRGPQGVRGFGEGLQGADGEKMVAEASPHPPPPAFPNLPIFPIPT